MRQEAPFCIQVELALGCNLQCHYCGLNGLQERPRDNLRLMTPDTAELVARRIADSGWNPRIEFARRGEPTLNPHMAEIVWAFRKLNPGLQLQATVNGGGLLGSVGPVTRMRELFDAGLNILAVDDYRYVTISQKLRMALGCVPPRTRDRVYELSDVRWREYPTDRDGHPNHRYPVDQRRLVFIEDIEASTASRQDINNHAGFGAPLRDYPKACALPFRELSVNWDGTVDLCCIDWLSEYRVGDLHERSIDDVWQDRKFQAARKFLIRGERKSLRPCLGCDHPSYNLNWLPGKGGAGREGYPEPNVDDAQVIHETNMQGPIERPTPRAMTNVYPSLPEWLKARWERRRGEPR